MLLPSPVSDGPLVRIPAEAATLEGFRAWACSEGFPQRGHISFLDQEIWIDMSPEEYQTHGLVKTEVGRVLPALNRKRKLGTYFSDRTLLTNEEAGLSTEPDGAFAWWKTLRSGRAILVPREDQADRYMELKGTPDGVMEIVSNSSVAKDTVRLRRNYHRAGIPEYWLIDARGEEIDFQILVHRKTDYVAVTAQRGWLKSRVFGGEFRLLRRRGELGLWEYTLQTRSR
jgi:Uma2 family endonuclease